MSLIYKIIDKLETDGRESIRYEYLITTLLLIVLMATSSLSGYYLNFLGVFVQGVAVLILMGLLSIKHKKSIGVKSFLSVGLIYLVIELIAILLGMGFINGLINFFFTLNMSILMVILRLYNYNKIMSITVEEITNKDEDIVKEDKNNSIYEQYHQHSDEVLTKAKELRRRSSRFSGLMESEKQSVDKGLGDVGLDDKVELSSKEDTCGVETSDSKLKKPTESVLGVYRTPYKRTKRDDRVVYNDESQDSVKSDRVRIRDRRTF